jgi:enterochelin esterase-like enzyme
MPLDARLIAFLACGALSCGPEGALLAGGSRDGGAVVRDGGLGNDGGADAGVPGPLDSRPAFARFSEQVYHTRDPLEQARFFEQFVREVEGQGGFPVRGGGQVTFVYRGSVASPDRFSVVGTFNGFDGAAHRLTQLNESGVWAATATLGNSARASYQFVDGDRAFADPLNGLVEWDGVERAERGEFRSVVWMPEHVIDRGVLRYEPGARDRWIYLPVSFLRGGGGPFPALYLHDGNLALTRGLFDQSAEALMRAGTLPEMVLVFFDVDGDRRTFDYTTGAGTGGNVYVDSLKDTLIPDLERRFRLSPDARAIAGVTLGGLVSFHAARRHPGFWGRVGALSPSFDWDGQRIVSEFRDGPIVPGRFYIDHDSADAAADSARAMLDALEARGYDFTSEEHEGGPADWPEWRTRFEALLRALFAAPNP